MIVRLIDGRKFDSVLFIFRDTVSGWYMKYIEVDVVDGKHVRKLQQIQIQPDWIVGIAEPGIDPVITR